MGIERIKGHLDINLIKGSLIVPCLEVNKTKI